MPTILDYYNYAVLATASYVRMGEGPYTGARFAGLANTQSDGRVPLVLGTSLFNPADPDAPRWEIKHYYGGDIPGNTDISGFGATLFEKGDEKVLALRGVEFGLSSLSDVFETGADLAGASFGGIGILGMALPQAISMINLIQRLKGAKDAPVLQLRAQMSLSEPTGVPPDSYVRAAGEVPGTSVYITFSTYAASGLDIIKPGDKVTFTGHSLGGHLAALAARLFPDLANTDVYVYNAAGFDPLTATFVGTPPGARATIGSLALTFLAANFGSAATNLALRGNQLTDELVAAINRVDGLLSPGAAASFAGLQIHNIESEDLPPSNDLSLVASFLTGAKYLGDEKLIPTEANSHLIEPLMDGLALQALVYSLNNALAVDDIRKLLEASSGKLVRSDEALTEALFRLFLPGATLNGGATTLPESDASAGLGRIGVGKGELAARAAFFDAVLRIQDAIKGKGYQLVSLVGQTTEDLLSGANDLGNGSLSYRYALHALNPFAVFDASGNLYAQFAAGGAKAGELDSYDPMSDKGLTDQWLDARAEMLAALMRYNGVDGGTSALVHRRYEDTGLKIAIGPNLINERNLFGSEGRDGMVGGALNDKLFGGGERDALVGQAGDDYLEGNDGDDALDGGSGNDTLRGGAGKDRLDGGPGDDFLYGETGDDRLYGHVGNDLIVGGSGADVLDGGRGFDVYLWNAGDGFDTITDYREGGIKAGAIMFLGEDLTGAKTLVDPENPKLFTDGNGVRYFLIGEPGAVGTLIVYKPDLQGGLTVQDFRSGDFGIVLPAVPAPAKTSEFGDGAANTLLGLGRALIKLFGLGGNDRILVDGWQAEGWGGVGDDYLINDDGDQYLYGEEGHDILIASGGNDELYGGTENDALQGGADDDYVRGDEGADVVAGGAGSDVVEGGEGNDFLFGGGSYVGTGAGGAAPGAIVATGQGWTVSLQDNVYVFTGFAGGPSVADDGADVIDGGAGDDNAWAGDGADLVIGGAGIDWLDGQAGSDTLFGDEDDDVLWGDNSDVAGGLTYTAPEFHGTDFLDGGAGNDILYGQGGSDALYGGAGSDDLYGDDPALAGAFHGEDFLDGGDGADHLWGGGGADYLVGGAGDDEISGDDSALAGAFHARDFIDGGDGNDTILGGGDADEIYGGAGNDLIAGDDEALAVAFHGDDYIYGGAGGDVLQGLGGDDQLDGGADGDQLEGGSGNDALDGGTGIDILLGGEGDDVYTFAVGDGNDTLDDASGNDTIRFGAGVGRDAVKAAIPKSAPEYVVLSYGSGDTIAVKGGATGAVEWVEYADGTREGFDRLLARALIDTVTYTAPAGASGGIVAYGGAQDDTLNGGAGNDILSGGRGRDVLRGGAGDDVYLFSLGDGVDRIQDSAAAGAGNTVRFGEGITVDMLHLNRVTGLLRVGSQGDAIQFVRFTPRDAAGPHAVEAFEFADGTSVTLADLMVVVYNAVTGTDTDDVLTGTAGPDFMEGGAGNDRLLGLEDDDVLVGGTGTDTLEGGPGDDVYVVDATGDTIVEAFDAGYDAVESEVDYALPAHVEDLALKAGTVGEGNTLANVIVGNDGANTLAGYDGDDALFGGAGNDTLDGGRGADDLDGGDGDDTLIPGAYDLFAGGGADGLGKGTGLNRLAGGTGSDTYLAGSLSGPFLIEETDAGPAATDVLQFTDLAAPTSALPVRVDSETLRLTLRYFSLRPGDPDSPLVGWTLPNLPFEGHTGPEVEEVRWGDGVVWDVTDLLDRARYEPGAYGYRDDEILSTDAHDVLIGNYGRDRIFGRLRNDTLYGGGGDDTLGGDEGDDELWGGAGDDDLRGGDGDDLIVGGGGGGRDAIAGGRGNDELIGGTLDHDTYYFNLGDGVDAIKDAATSFAPNKLVFGAGISIADLGISGLRLTIGSGGDAIDFTPLKSGHSGIGDAVGLFEFSGGERMTYAELVAAIEDYRRAQDALPQILTGTEGPDTLTGRAGNDTLSGLGGNDLLDGRGGDDVLDGGAGADNLAGGEGGDVYRYGAGYGDDVISESEDVAASVDAVELVGGLTPADVTLFYDARDLFVSINATGEWLTMFLWRSDTSRRVEELRFADGTVWDEAAMLAHATDLRPPPVEIFGTPEADWLYGTDGRDILRGLGGSDMLWAWDGDDVLDGGVGSAGSGQWLDTDGDGMPDTYIPGGPAVEDNDSLDGGPGSDTYVFRVGGGFDTIRETWSSPGDVDTLHFEGIAPWQVSVSTFSGAADFGVFDPGGNGGRISVATWFNGPEGRIERVTFDDGTVWDEATLTAMFGGNTGPGDGDDYVAGTSANDDLYGYGGNDTLDGGLGNDRLDGGTGNDTYIFGRGWGIDWITDHDATPGNVDTLAFRSDVAPGDVTLARGLSDESLELRVRGTGDIAVLRGWFGPDEGKVERVTFADGTVWGVLDIERFMMGAGTPLPDTIIGTRGDDVIAGLEGGDYIEGGAGDDVIDGGADADTLYGGPGNDVLRNSADGEYTAFVVERRIEDGTLAVPQGGRDTPIHDLLDGGAGDDLLEGGRHNDFLYGGTGDDTLDGGAGDDRLWGGLGNDTYRVDPDGGWDRIVETGAVEGQPFDGNNRIVFGAGIDPTALVVKTGDAGEYREVEALEAPTPAAPKLVLEDARFGGPFGSHDIVIGYQKDGLLPGLPRGDTSRGYISGEDSVKLVVEDGLRGRIQYYEFADGTVWSHDDLLSYLPREQFGGAQDDLLEGRYGVDVIHGGAGDDVIDGRELGDELFGGSGDDTILGGDGIDYLWGEAGDDALYGGAHGDYLLGGDGADELSGEGGNDFMKGQRGADVLYGGLGDDDLDGGDGDDVLDGGEGDDRLLGDTIYWRVPPEIYPINLPLSFTVAGDDTLYGGAGDDRIDGLYGSDRLYGEVGNDTLFGGLGDDELHGGEGDDRLEGDGAGVFLDVPYIPGAGGNDLLYGGSGNDAISGNGGNDYAEGGDGSDILAGDEGSDTLLGGDADDVLFGDADRYFGRVSIYAGDDFLDGGQGADRMEGGPGNDTYVVDDTGDEVREEVVYESFTPVHALIPGGIDLVLSSITYTLTDNVENLTLTGHDPINGTGNDLANIIIGNDASNVIAALAGNDTVQAGAGDDTISGGDGDDRIDGEGGADWMAGGAGADAFVVDDAGDAVVEAEGEGTDTVLSAVSFVLPAWVENLTLTGTGAIDGTGNGLDNVILGNDGDNVISGGDGNDWLDGAGGNDTIHGGAGDDYVEGDSGAGDDQLFGDDGNDTLVGNAGNDLLDGGVGDDLLDGGTGNDTLSGGGGNDVARYAGPRARYSVNELPDGKFRVTDTDLSDGDEGTDILDGIEVLRFADGDVIPEPGGNAAPVANDDIASGDEDTVIIGNVLGNDSDADGDSLTVAIGTGPAYGDLVLNPDGSFTYTPDANYNGSDAFTYTVSDGNGGSAGANVNITVDAVNDVPTVANAIANQAATEDAAFGFTLPANVFGDVDAGDSLALTVTLADGSVMPSWLAFDPATRTLSGTPANGDVGTVSLKVTATDLAGTSVTDTFDLSVANVNDAPTVEHAIADQAATEDAPFVFVLPGDAFADVDAGDSLTYAAALADGSPLPSWLVFDDHAFTGQPDNGQVGSITIKVTATDTSGASASDTFDLTVANVNDAPLAGADSGNATEDGGPVTVNVLANDTDVDVGDTKSVIGFDTTGTAGAVSIAAGGGAIVYDVGSAFQSLAAGATATDVFTYTMADAAGVSASATVTMTITGVNDAPTLAHAIADQSASEGSAFNFTVAGNAFNDDDAGDVLTYDATLADGSALPAWLIFDATTRTFSGTPGVGDVGSLNVRVTATDTGLLSAFDDFALGVQGTASGVTLIGGPGKDVLTGGAGNDTLDGQGGADLLDGAGGDDTLLYSRDGTWTGGFVAWNAGSPGNRGTGRTAGIAGKGRSHDVFLGGDGYDTLNLTAGDDAVFLDDVYSPFPGAKGPRLAGIEKIAAGEGNDVVDLTSSTWGYGDVTLEGGAGNDVLWASGGSDVLDGGAGNDDLFGGVGQDYLAGGEGVDGLNGERGNDLAQGGAGNDTLSDSYGNNLLDGGAGNDKLAGGAGHELFIGGAGNDNLTTGAGADILAFNRGDGRDSVAASTGTDNTLSLGGGIKYSDLTFTKSGNNLVLNTGAGESVSFTNWYVSTANRSVINLQMIAEAMSDFAAGGADPLRDQKVERFNFQTLVGAFDAAGAPTSWALTNALLTAHLGGSDAEAIGGDLAYRYGLNGTLAGIGVGSAQAILGEAAFGSATQSLNRPGLTDGLVKLT